MRVAFITPSPPYPLNAGNRIRTFHLLKHVGEHHDVTLLTTIAGIGEAEALVHLRKVLPGVTVRAAQVPSRTNGLKRCVRLLRSAVDPLPFTWAAYGHPRFRALLRSAMREGGHDIVHCDCPAPAHALFGLSTPPRLLNLHDVASVLFRRAAENEWNPWKKALIAWQSRKALRAEIPTYRFFDRVAVVSEVDRTEVERSAPGLPTSVVPNGVDAEWFAPSPAASDPDAMVFTGVMDWLPNVDGITFFVTHVLPRIRRVIPRVELTVVGRDPSPSLVRRLTGDGVRFTGTVEDVRPHVARARLVVVPLRIGGGTRLKILEAWAMEKAVLSTSIGAEGLPAVDGENIALADTADQMAERAVELLTDGQLVKRLGAAGRTIVEERFTWNRIADRLLDAYMDTIDGFRSLPPDVARPSLQSDGR